jgi:hypothetical protein
MDLSQSILFRSLEVNNAVLGTGRVLRGITVERVDYSAIETVGYTEKRAGSDGLHASDVYLGGRRIEMDGLIYATSLAEMFDFLHVVRSVFSPTSAYQESPGDRGFLPLHFHQPTLDIESFPLGDIPLFMNVRPSAPPRFTIVRDRQSRQGNGPGSTPWQAVLLAKDPRVYVDPAQIVDISGVANPTPDAVFATNRGDYETPMNIILAVDVATAGTFHMTGLNGIDMTITIEANDKTVYRWFGDDRVLMTEDVSLGPGTKPLVMRMDLVTFATKTRKPLVPAQINPPSKPFSTRLDWSCTVDLAIGSRLFWNEAFA